MRFLLLFFLLLSVYVKGQVVQVVDQRTNQPIEDVAIFNLEKSSAVVTDIDGKANIDKFSNESIITFQHPAYQEFVIAKGSLTTDVVKLSERIIKMKDVVVSANKWEQEADEIPNKIVSISANEIAFNNPQTSADMLSQSGQVFMQKSQFGGGSPKLRGFAANSVLIVVDGVRMNNAIFRGGNLQNVINIDPNALAGAEVILGPGSVIYGSDALGGVMDFHVKDPKFSLDQSLRTSATVFGRYSSAANEKTTHLSLGIGGRKVSWFSSFTYSDFGDLKAGKHRPDGYDDFGKKLFLVEQDFNGNDVVVVNPHPNTQSPSGFESWSTIQKLRFNLSDDVKLNYNFYMSNTSNIPRYDRLVEVDNNGVPYDAEWYYGPQKWMMNSLKLTYNRPATLFDQAKLIVARQDYKESRNDRGFGDNRLRMRTEEVAIWSANIDFDKQLGHGNLFYGFELLHNDVQSSAVRVNQVTGEITFPATRYPDGGSDYLSYAAYINHKWNIGSKFILNTGLRFSQVNIEAKITDNSGLNFPFDQFNLDNNAFNGSIGLVYNPNENVKVNIAAASGFRSPNIDDVGKVFDFSDGEVQVPNVNLKPEYTYNVEAGIETKLSENFEVGATIFYTWLDDAIVRQDFTFNGSDSIIFDGELSNVVALQNTGEANIYGYSFELEALLSTHWAVDATITNTFGRDITNDEPLRHTTPLFGKISVLYQKDKLRGEFYSEFNGSRFRNDIPDSEIVSKPHLYAMHESNRDKDGTPGWYTLNWKMSYQVSPNVSISGGIENILDKHYRTYSSGISAPGRNFIVSIKGSL